MLANANTITSCYIGPQISPEQFVAEHFFLFLAKGKMHGYDGNKHFLLKADESCVVRKNHLARYNKEKVDDQFEKVIIVLDEAFLKRFQLKHGRSVAISNDEISLDAFFSVRESKLIPNFIGSLIPYYNEGGKVDESFADIKREELLMILLKVNPEIGSILFDFAVPEKINLKEFMNRNYKFNVTIQRFAYLTGRSLTVFKKDFEQLFHETPSRCMVTLNL